LGESWDLFLLAAKIPRDPKGDAPLPTGKETSHSTKAEIGRVAEKGKTLESLSPQQSMPQKRGRPRNNGEIRKAQAPSKLCEKSITEELIMCIIRLELVEGPKQETCTKRRRSDIEDMDICASL
jgi:hypothetical protein